MKNAILDRILIFCYVVMTAAVAVITAMRAFGFDFVQSLYEGLEANAPGILWKLIVSGVAAIIVLLGIYTIVAITPSRTKKSNFITISGDESGEVKVALPALKDLVMQAISKIDGLSEMNVEITEVGDAIAVTIALDVESSVHVPTLTMNMQRAVRTYVQTSCGVAVKNVSVVVKNVIASPDTQFMPVETAAPASPAPVMADDIKADEIDRETDEAQPSEDIFAGGEAEDESV